MRWSTWRARPLRPCRIDRRSLAPAAGNGGGDQGGRGADPNRLRFELLHEGQARGDDLGDGYDDRAEDQVAEQLPTAIGSALAGRIKATVHGWSS